MKANLNTHLLASQFKYQKVTSIFLILNLILKSSQSTIVYQDLFNSFSDTWNSYQIDSDNQNKIKNQDCSDKKMLFIYQSQYNFLVFKTLELQPHYELKLELIFLRVKNQFSREFIIYIDGKIQYQKIYNDFSGSIGTCYYNNEYLIFPISITIQHSSPIVTISMIAENTYWGITEFQLSINECSNGCNFCNSQECFNQQLYLRLFNQKVFTVVNDEEGWQSGAETVNQIKECYGFNYIVSPGDNLHKIFDLEQHNLISFQVKLLIFNSESTNIHIYLDDNLVFATNFIYQQLKLPGYVCDYISFKEINLFQQQHSSKRLKIAIHVELIKKDNSNNLSTYIGIRDFLLFVNKDFDFICCDNNIIPFDGCFSNNYDCIQGCANCIKGICYDCLIGWEYKESTKSCIPSCGNSIINHYEECDDGNLVANDGCHNCQFSCPKNCLNCQFGKCLKCETQYQIIEGMCSYVRDEFENTHFEENKVDYNFLIIERQCNQYQLQHIYYNNINPFYHFDCEVNEQLKQQDGNCKVEQFGKCLECQDGYELNFNKKHCIPKCQDGIILSQEICDDGNSIQFDGCYKCQKSCQIECLFCSDNKCYNCQDGWQLQDYQCKQICGDGQIAILSQEQCDNIEDSNCTDCNYQCDHDCLVCDKFQNCEICQSSFEINDGKCIPICGDQIIISLFEQCDDGNDIPYDGCYQCQYQCSFGCIKCEKDNHCILCDEQQYYILDIQTFKCKQQQDITYPESKEQINNTQLLIVQCNQNQEFINNECVNLCGNGILNSLFEQCDDGNNNGGDGCSALCFEEDSYLCINQDKVLSICTFVQSPNFELTLFSDIQNQTKILELGFSQQVYIQSEQLFENIIEFIIIPQTQYVLSFNPLTNISNQLAYPKYQILVQFLEPVNEPILQINIQKFSIYNQYDLELNTNTKQIRLGTPFVLSQTTQQKVNQIIKMNDAIVYSTVSISAFLFLTGNYIVFFNLLDLLQSISYIRYMQYKFPPHLSQFLETYTKISLQPILDKLRVDELIIKLNGGTIPYLVNKQQKSQQTNMLNQMYLMNAKGCYFSYFLSLLTYSVCCLISSSKVSDWLGQYFIKHEENIKTLRLISYFQKKIQLQCTKVKNYYFSFGFFQLFYSTLQQLLFSTLLQFPDYTFNTIFEIINSIVALSSLIFLIQMFFRLLSITTSQIKNKQKWKYFFQDSKTEFWAANFKPFQIYKTAFYITIITEFIQYPEAQSVLLSMLSFFYLIYIIIFKPIKSNFEISKLICREITLLIILGSFLIYSLELNHDQFLFYGWLHISLFCFLLFYTLITDILDQLQKAYYLRLKKIQTQEKIKILQYYDNPLQRFVWQNNIDLQQKK